MSEQIAKSTGRKGRRFRRRQKRTVASLSKEVGFMKKKMAREQDIHAFTQSDSSAVLNTGRVTPISNVAQGTNYLERLGDQIGIKTLQVKLAINRNGATALNNALVRFIVFKDRSSNGAIPTTLDLFGTLTPSPLQPLDYVQKDRFYVLFDRIYSIKALGNITAGGIAYPGDIIVDQMYKKFRKEIRTTYAGTGSTAANLTTNQLYVWDSSDATANGPTISFWSRIKFDP